MDAVAYSTLPRVVLDNGSGFVKIGMASSKRPPYVTPNCVGHPKRKVSSHYSESHSSSNVDQGEGHGTHSSADSGTFAADNCYTLLEYFCYRPQVNSLVYDPNRQRLVWDRYIGRSNLTANNGLVSPGNLLSVNPESTSICLTEPNLCPSQSRQLSAEIVFEDFGFPLACFLSSQTASAFYYESLFTKKGKSDFSLSCYPQQPLPERKEDLACCLVVDCGFGSTHAVPFVNGEPIQNAALRTGAAGSLCNSYLKNVTALRSVNLEFNELVVQHMKEESCYVSRDFDLELRAARRLQKICGPRLAHHYMLPVYTSRSKTQMIKHFTNHRKPRPPLLNEHNEQLLRSVAAGEATDASQLDSLLNPVSEETPENTPGSTNYSDIANRQDTAQTLDIMQENLPDPSLNDSEDQCVSLFSERFSVPEVLFSPQDIKLNDCGIVELAYRSLSLCPPVLQPFLASNIFLCGGSTKFTGFTRRFYNELRPMIPQSWDLRIFSIEDPAMAAFYGAKLWTNNDAFFLSNSITRNMYFENGASVIKIDELLK